MRAVIVAIGVAFLVSLFCTPIAIKVFTRLMLEKIAPQLCGNHAVISPELLIRAQRAGYHMSEVTVRHRAREAGEQSGAKLKVVIESLTQLFELRRAIRQEG